MSSLPSSSLLATSLLGVGLPFPGVSILIPGIRLRVAGLPKISAWSSGAGAMGLESNSSSSSRTFAFPLRAALSPFWAEGGGRPDR